MLHSFIQFTLRILRWMHIDVYAIMRNRAERRMWRRALPKDGRLDPDGLCIAVPLRSFCSEAQVGRDYARRLLKSTVAFELFDLDFGYSHVGKIPEAEVADLLPYLTEIIHSRNVLAFVNGPVHGNRHYVYASQPAWEFERGMLEFKPDVFCGVRHVVLNSDFCTQYFCSVSPSNVQVHKIRYGYDEKTWVANLPRKIVRGRYGIPEDAFVVMFHFMFGSSPARKNPQGALAAFMKAFADEPRAHLVLKVAETNPTSADYQKLMRDIAPLKGRVTLVEGFLSRQDILNLLAASDAYLSLHRGEGLGIGMLEAMAVNTPVVCTNYGGNTEFCRPDTAYLVDYKLVPNDHPDHFYAGVPEWPEPNISAAARHLRAIFEQPCAAEETATRALAFIRDHFSLQNFKSDIIFFKAAMSSTKL